MRWPVFAVIAFVMLVLQLGLRDVIAIRDAYSPSFLLILAAFVGLLAPMRTVVIAFAVLGLLTDLISPVGIDQGPANVAIIGPATLGFIVAAYAVLQLRGLVYRDSLLAMAVMVFFCGVLVNLICVALLTLRSLPWLIDEPIIGWHASDELVIRFFCIIYSAALAIPVGFLLARTDRLWGFDPTKGVSYHH